jgi:hypothetical protein
LENLLKAGSVVLGIIIAYKFGRRIKNMGARK